MSEATATLDRQWALLRALPRWPQKATVASLDAGLREKGFRGSLRTVRRDLHELSARFPIVLHDGARPHGWSWSKHAQFEFMPRLTTAQAVALNLAREHLRHLLPRSMQRELEPLFDTADRTLAPTGWRDYHRRTRVVSATIALMPPSINENVVADVHHALARRCVLEANYRAKARVQSKPMTIHPLGLLVRGNVPHLVCQLFDYDGERQLALHRLSDTRLTDIPCREPPDFDFDAYAARDLAIGSDGPVRLHLRFERFAGDHLRETPLARNQTWQESPDGAFVDVTATVECDLRLRWWILAFGSKVTVLAPRKLREEIAAELRKAVASYET